MKNHSPLPDGSGMSLPEYLGAVRQSKGFTLREVQEATDNAVSNAYLSQLENGKIQKPSPNILHALAEVYGIEYTILMEKAGYITTASKSAAPARHGRLATLSKMDLTTEEEEELFRYLNYLRHSRNIQRDVSK